MCWGIEEMDGRGREGEGQGERKVTEGGREGGMEGKRGGCWRGTPGGLFLL